MNAADCTPGIVSATRTRPFGYSCCSIVAMNRAREPSIVAPAPAEGQSSIASRHDPCTTRAADRIRAPARDRQTRRSAPATPVDAPVHPAERSPAQPSTALYRVLARRNPTLAVELDGGGVLGGHLEVGPAQPGLVEALEGLADQGPAQPHARGRRGHAQVLDRADRAVVHHPLDGADVALGAGDQPGRAGQEARLAADLAHQPLAAVAVAQAGEDVRRRSRRGSSGT